MCKCTPAIRTPFCGKPGCEWPVQVAPMPPKELTYEEACAVISGWTIDGKRLPVLRFLAAQESTLTRLRPLIAHAIEVLGAYIEGCCNCDYGDGSTGICDGEPCEDCSHIRELRDKLKLEQWS